MSIRIGNTVYIEGMNPIEVSRLVADNFERIAAQFEVTEQTVKDLVANKPGGIVRVGRKLS